MKTLTTSMILSVMFLSAGAFAQSSGHTARIHAIPAAAHGSNVTVVNKNAAWPPAGQISVEPCRLTRCLAI